MRRTSLKEKGITLIALVVTIIVLLILAGISISMAVGNNGLIQRTADAKETTERAKIIETAQMDIISKQAQNEGNISKDELEEILTSASYNTQGTLSDEENILDRTLTSKDKKHKIPVSEIYNGSFLGEKLSEQFGPFFPIIMNAGFTGPDGKQYSYDTNMTWKEWVNSSYNTSNFSISTNTSDSIPTQFRGIEGVWFNGRPVVNSNGNYVLSNDNVNYGNYSVAIW